MKIAEQDELLGDWIGLNKELMLLSEIEIDALMTREKSQRARLRVMMRLYHRYSKLRGAREKLELASHAKA